MVWICALDIRVYLRTGQPVKYFCINIRTIRKKELYLTPNRKHYSLQLRDRKWFVLRVLSMESERKVSLNIWNKSRNFQRKTSSFNLTSFRSFCRGQLCDKGFELGSDARENESWSKSVSSRARGWGQCSLLSGSLAPEARV